MGGLGGRAPLPPLTYPTHISIWLLHQYYTLFVSHMLRMSRHYITPHIASQFKCIDFQGSFIAVLRVAITVMCNSMHFQCEDVAFLCK